MEKVKSGTNSQRADDLARVRNVVVFGIRKGISVRTDLIDALIECKIFVTNSGKRFSYSRSYVYLDALRYLGFDSSDYDLHSSIVWTSDAYALADSAPDGIPPLGSLNDSEKSIFRRRLFDSKAKEKFLDLFCLDGAPVDYQDFLRAAQPLYIVKPPSKSSQETETEIVEIDLPTKLNGHIEAYRVLREPSFEFTYIHRFWCLDAGIVDELRVVEAARYSIPEAYSHIIFPVDSDRVLSVDDFKTILFNTVGKRLTMAQTFAIPWLMYQVCPRWQISVETFKRLLIDTWQQNRNLLHLERGPGGLIRVNAPWGKHEYTDRFGNHRYYPFAAGTVRTYVTIFPPA